MPTMMVTIPMMDMRVLVTLRVVVPMVFFTMVPVVAPPTIKKTQITTTKAHSLKPWDVADADWSMVVCRSVVADWLAVHRYQN